MKVRVLTVMLIGISSCTSSVDFNEKHRRRMLDLEYLEQSYRLKDKIKTDSVMLEWENEIKLTEKRLK